jgi:8-oxo-dGTP pyrophosphatase MutT (NUDIX family)
VSSTRSKEIVPVTLGVLEILVAGVIGTVWLALLIALFAGSALAPSHLIEILGPIALVVYSAIAYGLGMIVDAVADVAERSMLKLLWPGFADSDVDEIYEDTLNCAKRKTRDLEDSSAGSGKERRDIRCRLRVVFGSKKPIAKRRFSRLRRLALSRGGGLVTFMEYQRSRQRIARSIALDLLLIFAVGGWFALRVSHVSLLFLLGLAVVTLGGALLAIRAAERLRHGYEEHLGSLDTGDASALRAASVCARRQSEAQMEILVVSTSEGTGGIQRWTLPKGHIEASEEPIDAAIREAREEAGVHGDVDPVPLRPYLFPSGRGVAITVVPFLISVRELKDPTEPGRRRRWCSPHKAKELLRESREAPYTDAHDAVIDEAMERLAETDA